MISHDASAVAMPPHRTHHRQSGISI